MKGFLSQTVLGRGTWLEGSRLVVVGTEAWMGGFGVEMVGLGGVCTGWSWGSGK